MESAWIPPGIKTYGRRMAQLVSGSHDLESKQVLQRKAKAAAYLDQKKKEGRTASHGQADGGGKRENFHATKVTSADELREWRDQTGQG